MKKQRSPLLLLTVAFAMFTAGFLAGRTFSREIVEISSVPSAPVHFGSIQETLPHAAEPVAAQLVFPVNINTADKEALTSLPGIGETLAGRILDYRKTCCSFSRPEELLNVEGIGPGKLEAILDLITTGG